MTYPTFTYHVSLFTKCDDTKKKMSEYVGDNDETIKQQSADVINQKINFTVREPMIQIPI